jgi:deoxycytidylate deaminase
MKIISYIGCVGSGKTTCAKNKAIQLRNAGYRVLEYNEPVDTNFYLKDGHYTKAQQYYLDYRRSFYNSIDFSQYDFLVEDASMWLDLSFVRKLDNISFRNLLLKEYHELINEMYDNNKTQYYIVETKNEIVYNNIIKRGRDFENYTMEDIIKDKERIISVIDYIKDQEIVTQPNNRDLKKVEHEIRGNDQFIEMKYPIKKDIIKPCNKYVVKAGFSDGTYITSMKLMGDKCLRKQTFGSDSNIYRNTNFCDSVHAEPLLINYLILNKNNKEQYGDVFDGKIYVTAHPCFQCMKHICASNELHNLGIKEIHYKLPHVDYETYILADKYNITLIGYESDRKDY